MKSITIITSVSLFLMTACGGTIGTFDDIKKDMTTQEVVDIMGQPAGKYKLGSDATGEIEIWHYKSGKEVKQTISFKNGNVLDITADFKKGQKKLKGLLKNISAG